MIDPKDTFTTLSCKCMLVAFELGTSNLKLLLQHKLLRSMLFKHVRWAFNLDWALVWDHVCSHVLKLGGG